MSTENEEECFTCDEDPDHELYPLGECPGGKRSCRHHCNCLWDQDQCSWCPAHINDDGELVPE